MNIPNVLTVIRFTLIPLFILAFFSSSNNSLLYSAYIFIFAGITDVLDGYIARKYNLITKWGQAMDPLADKLMQLTVLLCFTIEGLLPIWAITIVGVKELMMIFGGIFLYTKKDKIVIPANKYGKIATVIFYIAIISVVLEFAYSTILIGIAIAVTVYAFIRYFMAGVKEVKNKKYEEIP